LAQRPHKQVYQATRDFKKLAIWINDKKVSHEFDEVSFAAKYFAKTGRLILAGYDRKKGEILIMQGNWRPPPVLFE